MDKEMVEKGDGIRHTIKHEMTQTTMLWTRWSMGQWQCAYGSHQDKKKDQNVWKSERGKQKNGGFGRSGQDGGGGVGTHHTNEAEEKKVRAGLCLGVDGAAMLLQRGPPPP